MCQKNEDSNNIFLANKTAHEIIGGHLYHDAVSAYTKQSLLLSPIYDFSVRNPTHSGYVFVGPQLFDPKYLNEGAYDKGRELVQKAAYVNQTLLVQESLLYGDALSYFVYKIFKLEENATVPNSPNVAKYPHSVNTSDKSNIFFKALEIFDENAFIRNNVLAMFLRDAILEKCLTSTASYDAWANTYAWNHGFAQKGHSKAVEPLNNFLCKSSDAENVRVSCMITEEKLNDIGQPVFRLENIFLSAKANIAGMENNQAALAILDNFYPLPDPTQVIAKKMIFPSFVTDTSNAFDTLTGILTDYSIFIETKSMYEPLILIN